MPAEAGSAAAPPRTVSLRAGTLRFALVTLFREWRAGELTVLIAAILIAVAAMTAVGFFTERVSRAVDAQGAELLAADLVLRSGRAIPDDVLADGQARGLRVTRKESFASVVLAGDTSALADIEAVADGYPLRGRVRVASEPLAPAEPVQDLPARGEAWLDAGLYARLGIDVGATITIGALEMRATRVLVSLPDRGWGFADLAPPLLMSIDDVPATGLVQPGSRVSWYALFAGEPAAVADLRTELRANIASGEELRDLDSARPELRAAVTRARQFLGLAALCSSLVAATAIALAARRYAARHVDSVALLKCLGARRARIYALLALQLGALILLGGLVGAVLGYLVQAGVGQLLEGAFSASLPTVSPWRGAASGIVIAAILLGGFALPPLFELGGVPPARILRRELGAAPARRWLWQAGVIAAVAALLLWIARDLRIATYALLGAAGTCAALVACGWLLVRALRGLRDAGGAAWRYGLASLARRRGDSILQLAAFGLGLMLMLLIALVRDQLLDGWRARLPPDAPNWFLINIQSDEGAAIGAFLQERLGHRPELVPLVRARLTAIDDVPITERATDERGQRFVERESNLTWTSTLSSSNKVIAGEWWGERAPDEAEVSVEEEFAASLGIVLGDRLRFDIAGETLEAHVTSLRSVDWESFQPNFFMVLSPGVIEQYPATFITSLFLPPAGAGVLLDLVRRFPSVTPIDMNAIFAQVRSVMDRAVLAVQCVFAFALAAGITVLVAAVQTTRDERRRESALLRVFGARRATILRALAVEFGVLGLLAGVLATISAVSAAHAIAQGVFDLPFAPEPLLWLAGPLGGALLVGLAGIAATRSVLDHPPMRTLRGP
jgi:putative ABC transport system permease protein